MQVQLKLGKWVFRSESEPLWHARTAREYIPELAEGHTGWEYGGSDIALSFFFLLAKMQGMRPGDGQFVVPSAPLP